jgi:hypothetical protein
VTQVLAVTGFRDLLECTLLWWIPAGVMRGSQSYPR